jgi:hypothetical protein
MDYGQQKAHHERFTRRLAGMVQLTRGARASRQVPLSTRLVPIAGSWGLRVDGLPSGVIDLVVLPRHAAVGSRFCSLIPKWCAFERTPRIG